MDVDFGPTSFKFFDHWLHEVGFGELMVNGWNQPHVSGYASFCFKAILKLLKSKIKSWKHDHPNPTISRRDELRDEIDAWDLKAEQPVLSPDEVSQFYSMRRDFFLAEKDISLSLRQEAPLRWAVNGDKNSKFFHGLVKSRFS